MTNEAQKLNTSEERYPDEERLREILSEGTPLMIPRMYLHGRQRNSDYDRGKRRLAEKEIREGRIEYLKRKPIIVCALETKAGLQLVIIDGHHRTRYSSQFGINEIPSLVYTPQQLVNAFNANRGTDQTAEELTQRLNEDLVLATNSFSHMPAEKFPRMFKDAHQINDLPFERFDASPLFEAAKSAKI